MTEFILEVFDPRSTPDAPTLRELADYSDFLKVFREADWEIQVAQAEWAGNGWPGIALERPGDGLRFWVCAYDWETDFGLVGNRPAAKQAAFIVGLVNVPPQFMSVHFADGRTLVDSDFLIMKKKEVESLAELFFTERLGDLLRQLLRNSPVNRFSTT